MERQQQFTQEQLYLENEQLLLHAIADLRLSPCETHVLGAIRAAQLAAGAIPRFVVPRSQLVEAARANPGTVSEACRKLVERGLIDITRTGRESVFTLGPVHLQRIFAGQVEPISAPSRRATSARSRQPAPGQRVLPFTDRPDIDEMMAFAFRAWGQYRAVPNRPASYEITCGGWRIVLTDRGMELIDPEIGPSSHQHQADFAPASTHSEYQHADNTPISAPLHAPPPSVSAVVTTTPQQQADIGVAHSHVHENEMDEMNEGVGKGTGRKAKKDLGGRELHIRERQLATLFGIESATERYREAGRIGLDDLDDFRAFLRTVHRLKHGPRLPDEDPIDKKEGGYVRWRVVVQGDWKQVIRSQDRRWIEEQMDLATAPVAASAPQPVEEVRRTASVDPETARRRSAPFRAILNQNTELVGT